MATVKMKPTSPGRRHQVRVVNKDLQKHANDFLNNNMPNSNPEGEGN